MSHSAATPPLPQLRLVLAISLDGRLAPAGGGAAQFGGAGDRAVLEASLAWADGCLIGARTLRVHGTTCLIREPGLLARRAAQGRSPQPLAVVVSRSGQIAPTLPFFSQPLRRWLLQAADPAPLLLPVPPGFERRLELGHWAASLAELRALGLERLVLLGGAELAGALLSAQLVDELQLTLCPLLLGGPHTWLPAAALAAPSAWELVEHHDLGGGELLLRYRRPAALACAQREP
ncbi:dihydrofolate reductase family protein [Synechococcus sp. ATX 2A4]|uniref:RibD family protein n=1 Tax=Synechococcus sp. ATX 2A4 TaxID=2823727 RepID=UPI0037D9DD13|nr:dihydrofolate reductase family protein [Synechococcus sp. ATX 2A4]